MEMCMSESFMQHLGPYFRYRRAVRRSERLEVWWKKSTAVEYKAAECRLCQSTQ